MTEDVDATLLFQLSFKAEVMAFEQAYEKNFCVMENQPVVDDAIYYTISQSDMLIDFNKDIKSLERQSRAFGYKSKGLYFKSNGRVCKCFRMTEVKNPFVVDLAKRLDPNEVFISFDNSVVIKTKNGVLRLDGIVYDNEPIKEGQILENCTVEELMQE